MKNIIPTQKEGNKLDCFESVEFSTTEIASKAFMVACINLLAINDWHRIAEIPAAVFKLVDRRGVELHRPLQLHDYIKIDIPGPGLPRTKGFDWVNVVHMESKDLSEFKILSISLKPCPDPTDPENNDTAHFFEGIATSTLIVEQRNNSLLFQYAGRNEVLNTENSHLVDNVRNFMVGLGAIIGASYPQWKALIKGFANQVKEA
ncbi:hypothetical protein [Sphingobacterium faecium]|uniref:hypothetical protein n=1 Tax=Sphingobacterium faecium TaxID=34087 RepID=UPI000B9AC804|nr:hypothetical protein [Sphingobacterium faecium]UXD70884.1 hypothetical protein MUK51_06215 [Sphingobacterium faecium]WGQ14550.1 hypothetical protein QG727_21315 [Sphingobacterium faecium]